MEELSPKTKIALGFAFTAIGGGSAFCTKLYLMTDANASALSEQKQTIQMVEQKQSYFNQQILDKINKMSEDVAVIKQLVKEK